LEATSKQKGPCRLSKPEYKEVLACDVRARADIDPIVLAVYGYGKEAMEEKGMALVAGACAPEMRSEFPSLPPPPGKRGMS